MPGTVVLRLNRPSRLNALTTSTASTLCVRLDELATDAEVRVLVLIGAGLAFVPEYSSLNKKF